MEDEASAFEKMFGKAGEPVPTVDPADIKIMRAYNEDVEARHPGKQNGVSVDVWQHVLGPEAAFWPCPTAAACFGFSNRALQPFWGRG